MAGICATSKAPSNRDLTLRGTVRRPPWTDEALVRQFCTSCGDCISSCPEAILFAGPANTPIIRFDQGACTFCGECANSCSEEVFHNVNSSPWNLVAQISQDCLLFSGVSCRSCTDTCDFEAMKFDLRAGSVGQVQVLSDACTGCGACVQVCPTSAIIVVEPTAKEAAE